MEGLKRNCRVSKKYVLALAMALIIGVMPAGKVQAAEIVGKIWITICEAPNTQLTFEIYDDGTATLTNYSSNGGIEVIDIPQTVVREETGQVYTVTAINTTSFGAKQKNIIIPDTVTKIGNYVFGNCTDLTTITLPPNIEEVGRNAFDGCKSLITIYYPQGSEIDAEKTGIPETTMQISYKENEDGSVSLTIEAVPEDTTEYLIPENVGGHPVSSVIVGEGVDTSNLKLICGNHKLKTWNRDVNQHWMAECSLCGIIENPEKENHSYRDGKNPCICGYVPFTITSRSEDISIGNDTAKEPKLTITVTKTLGTEMVSYQWYENNMAISGATSAVYPVPADKQPGEYRYFCKVTSGSYVIDSENILVSNIKLICDNHKLKTWNRDVNQHWIAECSLCGIIEDPEKENHSYGDGKNPCICGYVPFTLTSHSEDINIGNDTAKEPKLTITVTKTLGTEMVSYQWYENNIAISGATSAVYPVPADKQPGEYRYFCKVTSGSYVINSENIFVTVVKAQIPQKGDIIKDAGGKAYYKVVSPGSSLEKTGTVIYMKPVKKSAKNVTIPATITVNGVKYKVTGIVQNAMKNNKNITKVTIGNNVKTIGNNAFSGCTKLQTITLGRNVTTIGTKAFYKCKKLKNITIKTTKLNSKRVGANAFKGIYKNAKIKVPKTKLKSYKSLLAKRGVSRQATIKQ